MRFGIFYEHQLPRPWAPDDEHSLSDGSRRSWAIEVSHGRARPRAGGAADAALTIRLPLADFIRVSTGAGTFYPLIADGRRDPLTAAASPATALTFDSARAQTSHITRLPSAGPRPAAGSS